jgi:DNA-binding response OmpR family regulator
VSVSEAAAAGRVLVVEDDPVAARFVMIILGKRAGFEVSHATGPETALALAESESWDLVLTDAELPGMSGLALLEAFRERAPQLPVAVLTGHSATDEAMQPLRSRADDFLTKPVRPDDLISAVTALVARGRAARGG